MSQSRPVLDVAAVRRLWFQRQGLTKPRGTTALDRAAFVDHLERTGGLQLDSVHVVDRAHYLTLWSRFGRYRRRDVDRWVYADRTGFDYWAHEASIQPASHLPWALHRMKSFPTPRTRKQAWWPRMATSAASKRRVLRRLLDEGPLESMHFKRRDPEVPNTTGWSSLHAKEDSRSLRLLWHAGRIAVVGRRHFRKVYDLAERVYPQVAEVTTANRMEYHDSWLERGLSGCGIAPEAHLCNYITGPDLLASERARVLRRNLRSGRIVEVKVQGREEVWYARPEDLDRLNEAAEPKGTTFVCPFDSLLWQRQRAADLLDFDYRIEIYVPPKKRRYGYYVLPILHDGRFVGRLDPKHHRDRGALEIQMLTLEPGVERTRDLENGIADGLRDLAGFLRCDEVEMPKGWRSLV